MFTPVDPKTSLVSLEEKLITYWKINKTFEKSISNRPTSKKWTFLDGPPFVTGKPHYGSLLSSLPKDVFGRYWTMKGYQVRRVWGWDGHGLPIENKVEGELKIERKKDIEQKVGVKVFIEKCLAYVNQISGEWEWYVDHIGRWVDFAHAYKTWDMPYMESVMWVFKQMYDKGYIYKGFKVSLYCPHCVTPISNFEVAMDVDNHKEILDYATTYKYALAEEKGTYILAWSTTPWNKIVTPALAVNPKFIYVKIKQGDEYYILAKSTLKIVDSRPSRAGGNPEILKQVQNDNVGYEIVEEIKGSALVGKKFVPHYDYYKVLPGEKEFEIIAGDFVTAEEGTGVVTIAAYGEEDLQVMKEQNVHIELHVDEEGMILPIVPKFGGMYYLKANKLVNEDLAMRGLIYKDEQLPHTVPLCWRCHTRLYHAPIDAWYVHVQGLKEKMKETNEKVNWFPSHFKYGRFLKSLESAPDWNISRNRYWGSPVPVWECSSDDGCGQRFVPGSIAELEEASGKKITNLHKPEIDTITVACKKCGKQAKRTPEVLDSWIEAGSASFAERHFPFDSSMKLEDFFPPDYIAEYTGQIRAWFYVLHVIGNAIYASPAFKNVSVTGVIQGTDGKKMSKNLKNYPDPKEMLQKYGGDALRLYLLGSPVMHGEDILISEDQYKLQVRGMLLILWNVYNFFISNAIADGWVPKLQKTLPLDTSAGGEARSAGVGKNVLDAWIQALLQKLTTDVTNAMEQFDTVVAIDLLKKFVDDFSTWYIRRSRDRVNNDFYETTYFVLVTFCKLLAPIAPFIADEIYQNLTGEESVHLSDWPPLNHESLHSGGQARIMNQELIDKMIEVRKIVELGLSLRKEAQIKVRQPLQKYIVSGTSYLVSEELTTLIKDELNVKEVVFVEGDGEMTGELDTVITPILKAEGESREIIRSIQQERKNLKTTLKEKVQVSLPMWPKEFEEEIKKKALVATLTVGEFAVKKVSSSPTVRP